MVDHRFDSAAGLQHAKRFSEGTVSVRSVMKHAPGIDEIKLPIGKREMLGIGSARIPGRLR